MTLNRVMLVNKFLIFLTILLLLANCTGRQEPQDVQSNGKVNGTVTIDGKPVNLSYIYARRAPTFFQTGEKLALVLTNKPVPEKDMPKLLEEFGDTDEQQDFLSDKSINGLVFIIDKVAIPNFDISYDGHVIKEGGAHFVRGGRFKDFSMKQSLMKGKTEYEDTTGAEIERRLSDGKRFTYKYTVEFETTTQGEPLFKEREGAVSPEIAYVLSKQGTAEGTLTVDDKVVNLKYAYGLRKREFFDEPEEKIKILTTDQPLSDDVLVDVLYKGMDPTKKNIQGVILYIYASTSKDFGIDICHKKIKTGIIGTGSAVEGLSITGERITTKTSDTQEKLGYRWNYSVTVDLPFK